MKLHPLTLALSPEYEGEGRSALPHEKIVLA
jgi:hypothetical protein